jgi:hypothetical protein
MTQIVEDRRACLARLQQRKASRVGSQSSENSGVTDGSQTNHCAEASTNGNTFSPTSHDDMINKVPHRPAAEPSERQARMHAIFAKRAARMPKVEHAALDVEQCLPMAETSDISIISVPTVARQQQVAALRMKRAARSQRTEHSDIATDDSSLEASAIDESDIEASRISRRDRLQAMNVKCAERKQAAQNSLIPLSELLAAAGIQEQPRLTETKAQRLASRSTAQRRLDHIRLNQACREEDVDHLERAEDVHQREGNAVPHEIQTMPVAQQPPEPVNIVQKGARKVKPRPPPICTSIDDLSKEESESQLGQNKFQYNHDMIDLPLPFSHLVDLQSRSMLNESDTETKTSFRNQAVDMASVAQLTNDQVQAGQIPNFAAVSLQGVYVQKNERGRQEAEVCATESHPETSVAKHCCSLSALQNTCGSDAELSFSPSLGSVLRLFGEPSPQAEEAARLDFHFGRNLVADQIVTCTRQLVTQHGPCMDASLKARCSAQNDDPDPMSVFFIGEPCQQDLPNMHRCMEASAFSHEQCEESSTVLVSPAMDEDEIQKLIEANDAGAIVESCDCAAQTPQGVASDSCSLLPISHAVFQDTTNTFFQACPESKEKVEEAPTWCLPMHATAADAEPLFPGQGIAREDESQELLYGERKTCTIDHAGVASECLELATESVDMPSKNLGFAMESEDTGPHVCQELDSTISHIKSLEEPSDMEHISKVLANRRAVLQRLQEKRAARGKCSRIDTSGFDTLDEVDGDASVPHVFSNDLQSGWQKPCRLEHITEETPVDVGRTSGEDRQLAGQQNVQKLGREALETTGNGQFSATSETLTPAGATSYAEFWKAQRRKSSESSAKQLVQTAPTSEIEPDVSSEQTSRHAAQSERHARIGRIRELQRRRRADHVLPAETGYEEVSHTPRPKMDRQMEDGKSPSRARKVARDDGEGISSHWPQAPSRELGELEPSPDHNLEVSKAASP